MFLQFRPVVPSQLPQQFVPMPSQHYQPVGPGVPMMNVGMPIQNQQPQFSQPIQQLHQRPTQQLPPPSQAIPMPVARPNMQIPSESMMPQHDSQAPNGYTPGLGGPGMPLSSSYTVRFCLVCVVDKLNLHHISADIRIAFMQFTSSSYGQVQTNFSSTSQYQPVPQIQAPAGSSSQITTPGTTPQSNSEQPTVTSVMPSV